MKIKLMIFLFITFSFLLLAQEPNWEWVTQAGSINTDIGHGITIDNCGNSYVTGSFTYTATFGLYSIICNGVYDIFIAKMDMNGNWLWVTQAGGIDPDVSVSIVADNLDYTYITGCFGDTIYFGDFSLTSNGWADIFIAKIDMNGNWMWATQAGGTQQDFGEGIKIDNAGNIYVTGSFTYPATFGSTTLVSNGIEDIFIAKMDMNGNWLWATQAGGTSDDSSYAISVDDCGNSYVTGLFTGTVIFGSTTLVSYGSEDIFIAKIDTNGNWLWATQAGGDDNDCGGSIAIDNGGNSYITGSFYGTAFFGSISLLGSGSGGDTNIFVAKLDDNGNWLWATQAGGDYDDWGYGISVDYAGNSFVTGSFKNTATFGSHTLENYGYSYSDIFIAKMNTSGNWLWAIHAGGDHSDRGEAITIDDAGNSYVTGRFKDTATFGSYSLTSNGWDDIFVAKLNSSVSVDDEIIPTEIELSNYPNPFNPSTTISFSIPEESNVELTIFNIKGQKIKTLAQNEFTKGSHSINWNGNDESENPVNSGIYLYKLKVNGQIEAVRKCLLLK